MTSDIYKTLNTSTLRALLNSYEQGDEARHVKRIKSELAARNQREDDARDRYFAQREFFNVDDDGYEVTT